MFRGLRPTDYEASTFGIELARHGKRIDSSARSVRIAYPDRTSLIFSSAPAMPQLHGIRTFRPKHYARRRRQVRHDW